MLSHIGAWGMNIIDLNTAKTVVENALASLKNLEKNNGLFYRYYYTHKDGIVDREIPSIGNAMLALSLIAFKQWALENNFAGINSLNPSVYAQIIYATRQNYNINGTVVWGISDCYDETQEYCWEYRGSPPTNANYRYGNNYECQLNGSNECKTDSCTPGFITPHASALAILSKYSTEATENLMNLKNYSNLYHDSYGFKDSLNVKKDKTANIILTLDQQWINLSL